MNYAKNLAAWGDRHHPWILDIIRILLGLFLMNKGIVFLKDSGYLRDIILEKEAINQPPAVVSAIVFYVSYIHVLGGGLMALGLFTRLWAILQFPVVVGAVIGWIYNRSVRGAHAERLGVLVASGMIVGESLFGVINAGLIVGFNKDAPLAVVGASFPADIVAVLGFVGLIALLYGWLMRRARAA